MCMQKKMDGLFLIRIEDTDRQRSTKEFEKNILDSLSSIGLNPDLDPINQSERTDIYTKAANEIFIVAMHITVTVLKIGLMR